MAYSDWTALLDGTGSANSAEPYAPAGSLPAPDGSSGSYARALFRGPGYGYSGFVPSSPSFTGVPGTKAIRIQSYFRTPNNYSFIMAAKAQPSPFDYLNYIDSGYSLMLRAQAPVNLGITFNIRYNSQNYSLTLANAPLAFNAWYSFRMTVYPIAPLVDRVIIEQESAPGSGVWSSSFAQASGDIIIDGNAFPNRFVPWGGSSLNGVWGALNGSQDVNGYIDKLQVSLANAPVPIP